MAEMKKGVGASSEASTSAGDYIPLPLRAMAWIAGSVLIATSVLIVCEAILRKTANISIGGVNEITAYVFAITTAWALPYALWVRANVRIDAFYTHTGLRLRLLLEFLALFAIAAFFGYLTLRGGGHAFDSLLSDRRSNSSLQTPLAIPQLLWLFGLVVQMITIVALIAKMAKAAFTGEISSAISVMASGNEAAVATEKVESAQQFGLEPNK